MIVNITDTYNPGDIYISTFKSRILKSNEIIRENDYSHIANNNTVPASIEDIGVFVDYNNAVLDFPVNSISSIMITNEESYDFKTAYSQRLWYRYTCRKPYYPRSITNKYKEGYIDIDNNIYAIKNLNTSNTSYIVENTLAVEYYDGYSWVDLDMDLFGYDLTKGIIYLIGEYENQDGEYVKVYPSLFSDKKVKCRVSYELINSTLNIPRENDEYRVNVTKITDNQYLLDLFLVDNKANYDITYPTYNTDGNRVYITERINPTTLFNLVNYDDLYYSYDKHTYAEKNNIIYVNDTKKRTDEGRKVFIKSTSLDNTKVNIKIVNDRLINDKWVVSFSFGEFEYNGYTYSVLEQSSIKSLLSFKYEKLKAISPNTVKLSYSPLAVLDYSNSWYGIKLYRNNKELNITDIARDTKLITVSEDLRSTDLITAYYQTVNTRMEFKSLNLNPTTLFGNLENKAFTKYYVFVIIPKEQLNFDSKCSIFYNTIEKLDSKNNVVRYTESEYISLINETSFITSLISSEGNNISEYTSEEISSLKPYLLSVMSIEDIYSPDSITHWDSRNPGGGIEKEEYSYIQDLSNSDFHHYDIGFWDGNICDISGILEVVIPLNVRYAIKDAYYNYDLNTQLVAEDKRDNYALGKADEYIKNLCERSVALGKKVLIKYV